MPTVMDSAEPGEGASDDQAEQEAQAIAENRESDFASEQEADLFDERKEQDGEAEPPVSEHVNEENEASLFEEVADQIADEEPEPAQAKSDGDDASLYDLEPGNWTLPKNVSPSEIKVYERARDGKIQVIYGNERDESGDIV